MKLILEYGLYLAGIGLLLICLANGIAPKMLRWTTNLQKTEVFFQQVFKVHAFYIVLTMLGMALACFFATDELLAGETVMAKGFLWFSGAFWGLRVILHVTYYENTVKRKYPYWNLLFLGGFAYLATIFLTTAIV